MNKKVLMLIAAVVAVLALVLLIVWATGLDNSTQTPPQQTTSGSEDTSASTGPSLGNNGVGEIPDLTLPEDTTEPSTDAAPDDSTPPTAGGDEVTDPTQPSAGEDEEKNPTHPSQGETLPTTPATKPGDSETEPADPTDPTQPPVTDPPVTESPETEPPVTEPVPTDPTEPERAPEDYTYEEYMAMTSAEQQAFSKRFPSGRAFMQWYNDAYAAYEAAKDEIEVEGGNVNIGDYMDGNGNG